MLSPGSRFAFVLPLGVRHREDRQVLERGKELHPQAKARLISDKAVDRGLHGSMAKQELNLIPVRHLRNTAWHKYATGRAGRGSRFLLG
jgi:hypothetical protein